jgi:hypothetical protein
VHALACATAGSSDFKLLRIRAATSSFHCVFYSLF